MTTPAPEELARRLRDHENEGVTSSDRFHLREEAAAMIDRLSTPQFPSPAVTEEMVERFKKINCLWTTHGDLCARCRKDNAISCNQVRHILGLTAALSRTPEGEQS